MQLLTCCRCSNEQVISPASDNVFNGVVSLAYVVHDCGLVVCSVWVRCCVPVAKRKKEQSFEPLHHFLCW